jgi:hypothetical protein
MTNHITTTPTLSAVATKTSYHVLRRLTFRGITDTDAAGKDTFELVYQALEATSAEAAIKYFATGKPDGNHDKAIEGTYVAIPSRSFVEKTVKVETTTTVKLA